VHTLRVQRRVGRGAVATVCPGERRDLSAPGGTRSAVLAAHPETETALDRPDGRGRRRLDARQGVRAGLRLPVGQDPPPVGIYPVSRGHRGEQGAHTRPVARRSSRTVLAARHSALPSRPPREQLPISAPKRRSLGARLRRCLHAHSVSLTIEQRRVLCPYRQKRRSHDEVGCRQVTLDQAGQFVLAAYHGLCPVPGGSYDYWAYSTS
jgi:hypothetical protein